MKCVLRDCQVERGQTCVYSSAVTCDIERRLGKLPGLEKLCAEYGGLSKVTIVAAFKGVVAGTLSQEGWDTYVRRTMQGRVDRVMDSSPIREDEIIRVEGRGDAILG